MGQPAFIFGSYGATATVTASSSASGYTASDILSATEDVGHMPSASGDIAYTIDCGSIRTVDSLAILGEHLDGLDCSVQGSSNGTDWTPLETSLATNGSFASDTGWTKGTGWTISGGKASSDGSQTGNSDLSQGTLVSGQRYLVKYTVSSRSAGSVAAVCGTQAGTSRSADGTYIEAIVANAAASFKIRADADFVGSVDDVSYAALPDLDALLTAAWRQFTSSSYRYFKVTLYAAPSNLLVNHICLDALATWPYLEEDWDNSNLQVDGDFLVSQAGYFAGGTAQAAMRSLSIAPGVVTTSEIGTLTTFADDVIRNLAGCFFVPDVTSGDCYFGWIEGKSFAAPLKNGAHEVAPMTFRTRAT